MYGLLILITSAHLLFLALALSVLALVQPLRINRYGNRTRKAIRLQWGFLALSAASGALAFLLLELFTPGQTLMFIILILVGCGGNAAIQLFFAELTERGLRGSLAAFRRFLERLLKGHTLRK